MFLYATENPLTLNSMTTMILPFSNFTLIYLDEFPWSPNFLPSIKQGHLPHFTAKHVPVNSCVQAKRQLLFYLPPVQVLAPPICKFQHLFNCQVRFFKLTSVSNAPHTSMPFAVDLLSTLPDVAIGPVSTLNQRHFRSTNSAHSTRCDKPFIL